MRWHLPKKCHKQLLEISFQICIEAYMILYFFEIVQLAVVGSSWIFQKSPKKALQK